MFEPSLFGRERLFLHIGVGVSREEPARPRPAWLLVAGDLVFCKRNPPAGTLGAQLSASEAGRDWLVARASSAACGGISVPKCSSTVSWDVSPYQRAGLEFKG